MTAHATLRKTTGRTFVAGGATSGLATALVAALLAATVAAASASPTRSGEGPAAAPRPGQLVDVVCFTSRTSGTSPSTARCLGAPGRSGRSVTRRRSGFVAGRIPDAYRRAIRGAA